MLAIRIWDLVGAVSSCSISIDVITKRHQWGTGTYRRGGGSEGAWFSERILVDNSCVLSMEYFFLGGSNVNETRDSEISRFRNFKKKTDSKRLTRHNYA